MIKFCSGLSIFLLFASLTSVAGKTTFSFFDRAVLHYNQEKELPLMRAGNPVIDSLLEISSTDMTFVRASDLSWKIGLFLLEQGKHAAALDIFLALRDYLHTGSHPTIETRKKMSSVMNVIGAIYEETGLWNEALALYLESLRICDSIGYQSGKAKVFNNIGNLYFNRNELKKAEELFTKAIEINKDLSIRSELFNNYNNMGGIYKKMNDLNKALEYVLLALSQLDINRDFYDLSFAYANIGNLYQEMHRYSLAMSYYGEAAGIQRQRSYTGSLIRSMLSLSTLYQEMNQPDSAETCLNEALSLSEQLGNSFQRLSVLIQAAKYFEKNGNYRKATQLYDEYVVLNDSLQSLNSLTRMEQIQAVYQVLNKEKDNKILQQKIDLQQLAIQRQRIVLIAAIVVFMVLGFFLFYLFRSRRRERANSELIAAQTRLLHEKEKEMMIQEEQNLKMELDYKNRRFTSYALNLARTNEFILKITEELKQLLMELNPRDKERSDRVKKLMSELQQYSSGHDWEEFRLYFEEVHQSFEKNLLASYPNLSPNDRKICALLKLGLSTKDIAAITFRELRSVESARNRLRKKFGLSTDINLHTFLSKF